MTRLAALLLLLAPGVLLGRSVTLGWTAGVGTNVAGYYVYTGTASRSYQAKLDTGTNLTATISNLVASQTYYFAATAYDALGNESLPSAEVSVPGALTSISNLSVQHP